MDVLLFTSCYTETSLLWSAAHTLPGPGGGSPKSPLQTSSPPLSPGKRCGATAQSALGWYRPSVGVPETLDGKPSGYLFNILFSVQYVRTPDHSHGTTRVPLGGSQPIKALWICALCVLQA